MSFVNTRDQAHVSLLGTTAILFEAPGAFDLPTQRRIWSLARTAEAWPGIKESMPGMTNLMLTFEAPPRDPTALESMLLDAWGKSEELEIEGRVFELPVVYGGEDGPHLAEAAALTGLSIDDLVDIHTSVRYTVFAVGAHLGQGYLGITDSRIWVARRKVPVMSVPAGSVSIAGMQTAVSTWAGPSGWHTLGNTKMTFFDSSNDPPAVLAPGDTIVFRAEKVIR